MTNTVLLVEDYDDARCLMKLMLEQQGYRVVEATDGYEAVERAENETPDLVLMDMSLPMMDGVTATRKIKEIKDELPVVAVTAHGFFYQEKALEAGCDLVINKPVDLKTLKKVVSHYLPASH